MRLHGASAAAPLRRKTVAPPSRRRIRRAEITAFLYPFTMSPLLIQSLRGIGDAGGGERAVGLGHLGWLRLKWESFSLSTQTLAPWLGWEEERRR